MERRKVLSALSLLSGTFWFKGSSLDEMGDPLSKFHNQVLEEMAYTKDYLSDWFAGRIPRPPINDFYLEKVLAHNFTIVRPDGRKLSREQTLEGFYNQLHGSDPEVVRHDNRNIFPVLETESVMVMSYTESHVYPHHEEVNQLTAVFIKDLEGPRGVKWVLVHETPIL